MHGLREENKQLEQKNSMLLEEVVFVLNDLEHQSLIPKQIMTKDHNIR